MNDLHLVTDQHPAQRQGCGGVALADEGDLLVRRQQHIERRGQDQDDDGDAGEEQRAPSRPTRAWWPSTRGSGAGTARSERVRSKENSPTGVGRSGPSDSG